ncbi:MAG: hypothetical protein QOK28_2568 [Actinomycetota bacterium]|jgi:lysophospholipase L1-like esterase
MPGGLDKVIVAVVLALVGAVSRLTGVPPAPEPPGDPLVYVALGDSYTSGPLVLPHDDTFVPQDCAQSTRNYPHIASQMVGVDVFRDVSCAGATIDDFSGSHSAYAGSNVGPQYDALDADVDVVTVGIGGNDVGFVGAALGCVQPPSQAGGKPCTPSFFVNGVDTMSQAIAAMQVELGTALDHIHTLAPHAKVLVVSYPDALPDDGVGCYPYVPILNEDMPYLTAKFKEMNAALKSAAESHAASYVDIYTPSIGHDACKPPGLAWVSGMVLVPPGFPAHPNDLSFVNSGPVVASAITAALH